LAILPLVISKNPAEIFIEIVLNGLINLERIHI
jgi:hypothetical protein